MSWFHNFFAWESTYRNIVMFHQIIHAFRPCLIVEVFATKFHEQSVLYCDQLQIHFSPQQTLLLASTALWPNSNSKSTNSRIRLHCTFICVTWKLHMERTNAQRVSAPNTMILPTTVGGWQISIDNKIERKGFLDGDVWVSFFIILIKSCS